MVDFAAINAFNAGVQFKEIKMASGSLVIRCTHPDRESVVIGIASDTATVSEIGELRLRLRAVAHRELQPKQQDEWDII